MKWELGFCKRLAGNNAQHIKINHPNIDIPLLYGTIFAIFVLGQGFLMRSRGGDAEVLTRRLGFRVEGLTTYRQF